ncbi:hypothetical protein HHK36_026747 [Tetracentron sinense]|uniref:N-acetyltransferase domain-containing protein n=1 Tax=Tetracentron sinense TaxID=13715 RepID=A0A835D2X0_TETSI|nr:hypothetical protein HHK36_026747 [Tetracentron sinense]
MSTNKLRSILVVLLIKDMKMDLSKISLRPFKLSDVDDFMVWASDDQVTKHLRWNSITSREEALTYLKEVAIPHPWRRSICFDDRPIGCISVRLEPGDDKCRANIGYALATQYWGQGIVTTAMRMALSCVFKDFPDLVRVQAFVEVENKGSQRVLEKAGFLKEGLLRKYLFNKGNQTVSRNIHIEPAQLTTVHSRFRTPNGIPSRLKSVDPISVGLPYNQIIFLMPHHTMEGSSAQTSSKTDDLEGGGAHAPSHSISDIIVEEVNRAAR